MKTRPRIRRATLWGGVVVSAVLIAMWAVSTVSWLACPLPGKMYGGVAYGALGFAWTSDPKIWGSEFESRRWDEPTIWWVDARDDASGWWVLVPLWIPLVVSLGVTAAAWRLEVLARRRQRAGFCASCGYDRAGLKAGAVCPECGAA